MSSLYRIAFLTAILILGMQAFCQSVGTDSAYATDSVSWENESHAPKRIAREWEHDSIEAIKTDKAYHYVAWMDSLVRSRKAEPTPQPRVPISTFVWFVRVVIIIGIIVIIYWLATTFLGGRKSFFRKERLYQDAVDTEEALAEEAPDKNALQAAIQQKNYRRATRILYLMTLEHLDKNNHIHLAPQKTNYQYLQEIGDQHLRREFSALLLYYEYIWFGHFDPTSVQFDTIYHHYSNFLNR